MLKLLVVGLTVALTVLKILGDFDGSWVVVFSPIIAYIFLAFIIIVIKSIVEVNSK